MKTRTATDDMAGARRSVGTVRVGRTNYAVAVLWDTVADTSGIAKKAKAHAAQPSVQGDFYVVHPSGSQVGAGEKSIGHAKGMVSLAAALALSQQGSWIAVFEVPEGYYFVGSQSDNSVFGDVVYGDEASALAELLSFVEQASFDRIYAPEGFNVGDRDNVENLELAEVIGKGRGPRLQPASGAGGMAKILLLLLVVGGGGIGWMMYSQHLADLAAEEELARILSQEPEPVQWPAAPWEGRSVGSELVKTCVSAISEGVYAYAGWSVQSVKCGETGVTASLTRKPLGKGGGPITWVRMSLDQAAQKNPDHQFLGEAAGKDGKMTSKASASPVGADGVAVGWGHVQAKQHPVLSDAVRSNGQDPYAASFGDVKIAASKLFLVSEFETKFVPLEFSAGSSSQFFASERFAFKTRFDPTAFADVLNKIKGLTIDEVSYDFKEATYTVNGEFHEKLPPPRPVS